MNPNPKSLNPAQAFTSKLESMQGMDVYRLRFKGPPAPIPEAQRAQIDQLYSLNQTQVLIASVIDAMLSFGESVFLLSRSDCQNLILNNSRLTEIFSLSSGSSKRAYAGMLAEMERGQSLIRITLAGKNKPMVVEVIDPFFLSVIGVSTPEYRARVFRSVGLDPDVVDF